MSRLNVDLSARHVEVKSGVTRALEPLVVVQIDGTTVLGLSVEKAREVGAHLIEAAGAAAIEAAVVKMAHETGQMSLDDAEGFLAIVGDEVRAGQARRAGAR